MRLGNLVDGGGEAQVGGFAIDHRKVKPGYVFGAFEGAKVNGEDYIAEAVQAGAIAVVARPQADISGAFHIKADSPRATFAQLAASFYAPFPAVTVAVTGTNGKTSTVELTRQLWQMVGHSAASIGTLGVITADQTLLADEKQPGGLTTPDIVTFLETMSRLARRGISHAAFETSSHGLSQYRTEGLPVLAAGFTNLSRDHLDYHGTMEAYFAAKLRLFSEVLDKSGTAVVWADDEPWSERVRAAAAGRGIRTISVGRSGTDIRLVAQRPDTLGQWLEIEAGGERYEIMLPLIGGYQAANALLAAGMVIACGENIAQTIGNLARLLPVRGRLEHVGQTRAGAAIYVDYAHTPDAIDAAAAALRPHIRGQLILVFGAGGDRDAGKRPLMGEAAARVADVVIVTDDNPRSEDPAAIRQQILAAVPGAQNIADRRDAIAASIEHAGGDDVILIAGKGHEQGQTIGALTLPFDDVQVARELAA